MITAWFEIGRPRPDGDNVVKAVLDAGSGVLWTDDRQVREFSFRRMDDRPDPGLSVTIERR